ASSSNAGISFSQQSHHIAGDCCSRELSLKGNTSSFTATCLPFSSNNTTLAPCVPISIPMKKEILIEHELKLNQIWPGIRQSSFVIREGSAYLDNIATIQTKES